MRRAGRSRSVGLATAAALLAAPAAAASAQRALQVGLAAGATPVSHGDWDRGYAGGTHAQLSLALDRALGPLGVRADVFVHGFRRKTFGGTLSRRTTIPGATVSLVLPLGVAWAMRPYVLGGGGAYQTEYGNGRAWHPGLAAGAGVRFDVGRLDAFIEGRVHRTETSTPRLVPLSVGIGF